MQHVVIWRDQKIKVSLPNQVPSGQPFTLKIEDVEHTAVWLRAHGVLLLQDQKGVEQVLRLRRGHLDRDGDRAVTRIAMEAHTPGTGLRSMHCEVAYHGYGASVPQSAGGEQIIRSQITGKVLRVLVKEGDPIASGQVLLVIEAMKMENRIFAKEPGRVRTLNVAEGEQVQTGKELLRIAP